MMTARDEDLLQARLDGELGPGDATELQRRLGESVEVRQRAHELDRLAAALDELAVSGPAPDVTRDVMMRIERPRAVSGGTMPNTVSHRVSNRIMPKKVMWGLAAAAAVVIGVLVFTDFPPVDNTQGAIGAAKRYNGQQMSQGDVQLGDTSAQAFLQSDTFARIMSDPSAVKLLSDASIRTALADPGVARAFADPAMMRALTSAELRALFSNAELARAISHPDLQRAMSSPDLVAALSQPELARALAHPDLQRALASPELARALTSPELARALSHPDLARAFASADFARALANADLVKALSDASLSRAISSAAFAQALSQAELRVK